MTLLDRFTKIRCFAFDVDGVLTDGTLLILENGQFIRRMHIKDGYALQLAVKKGYKVVIISGSNADPVVTRLNLLGIEDVFMNVQDKNARMAAFVTEKKLLWEEVLFMGDDIPDYEVLQAVGISCAPADAVAEIRQIAKYISPVKGGEGCVRDVIEKVLRLNGHWDASERVASR